MIKLFSVPPESRWIICMLITKDFYINLTDHHKTKIILNGIAVGKKPVIDFKIDITVVFKVVICRFFRSNTTI